MEFYVMQYQVNGSDGMPRVEFLSPDEYWDGELPPNIFFTQKVAVENEAAAAEWQALYTECEIQKSWPNQSPEELADNARLCERNEARMRVLEDAGQRAAEREAMEAQRKLLHHVALFSDETLYPLAEKEAEKWVTAERLPLNKNMSGFLNSLRVAAGNGPEHLDAELNKNLSLVAKSGKVLFRTEMTALLTDMCKLVRFTGILDSLMTIECSPQFAQRLRLVVLTEMQKDFIQHFVAHLEYSWSQRYQTLHRSVRVK